MPSTFTRIIRRELPGEIVYETEREIAFLDIFPASEGHTLVAPKREVAAFDALTADEAASLMLAVRRVAKALTRAMGTPHYNVMINTGAPAGQVVFHVHVHVIPRWEGLPRQKRALPPERLREIAARIRAALAELPAEA
jgi:histidine triad (HIT) family protein